MPIDDPDSTKISDDVQDRHGLGTTVEGSRAVDDSDVGIDSSLSIAPIRPPVPESVGRFIVETELGRGRFGVVYAASDPTLKRHVAVKVARPEFASETAFVARFVREAAAIARLDHPSIVDVHDVGTDGQYLFIAMEFCPGRDLAKWMSDRTEPVEPRLAADLVRQVAVAIEYAHGNGVIHRDLKPGNLMMSPVEAEHGAEAAWRIRVLDFGVARTLEDELSDSRSSMIVGTPLYMAPEQAGHGRGDPRTDVFSIGAILYELLTGRPPFPGERISDVFQQLESCEPDAPTRLRPSLDPRLETISLRCLRRFPEDRYQTAGEVADDLERYLDGESIRARPVRITDRLASWARSSDRLNELGMFVMVTNVLLFLWTYVVAILAGTYRDVQDAMSVADLFQIWAFVVSVSPISVATALVGWRAKRRRVTNFELWFGLATNGLLGAYALCVQIEVVPPPTPWYAAHPVTMQFVHTGITLVLLAQASAFGVMLVANRECRRDRGIG